MDEFETWLKVYTKTIGSLQRQKISSSKTRIDQYSEELSQVEKSKAKVKDGIPVERIISDLGMKMRRTEDTSRRAKKILESLENDPASVILTRLEKHSSFAGIVPDNETGDLNLYTKSLKSGRETLGKYRIVFNSKDHSFIRMVNLDYHYTRHDHWALNHFKPCLGEWGDDIVKITNEGNLFYLFDTLILYLISAGSKNAYMSRSDWFKGRKKIDKEVSERKRTLPIRTLESQSENGIYDHDVEEFEESDDDDEEDEGIF